MRQLWADKGNTIRQGCGSGPFVGSFKSEFEKLDPDPAHTQQESIQPSKLLSLTSIREFYVDFLLPEQI